MFPFFFSGIYQCACSDVARAVSRPCEAPLRQLCVNKSLKCGIVSSTVRHSARAHELEGDRLTLSTPLMLVGGIQLSTHLIWERV